VAAVLDASARVPATRPAKPFFALRGVSKSYGHGPSRAEVLHDLDLALEEGELVAIVGFSGSGKTTLISIMAGLVPPDAGEVLLEGEPIRGPGPDRGVVFQNYSLLPWLTVEGNVALAVDQVFRDEPAAERKRRVDESVALVGLTAAAHKRPAELSGGMRQRVAVARALAIDPKVLLLDEPLSALDALTRGTLQDEIERIRSIERKTVVLVTNSVDEAILLADRIVPLDPGPRASLGPSFRVGLPRPRDRATINRDPEFRRIRVEVTRYLIDVQSRTRPVLSARGIELPDLSPVRLGPRRTGWLR
jgi:nitrate/nitrite transport system ATP-binding protein